MDNLESVAQALYELAIEIEAKGHITKTNRTTDAPLYDELSVSDQKYFKDGAMKLAHDWLKCQ